MATRHHPKVRALGNGRRFVKTPGALEDGKVRCQCGTVVGLTPNGRQRKHNDPRGDECPLRTVHAPKVHLAEVPPVAVPPKRKAPVHVPASPSDASRLDAGSHCETCDKWIPGERRFCGQCARKRDADRRGKP